MTQAIQQYEKALEPIMPSVLGTLTSNMDRVRFAQCMYLLLAASPQALMPCVQNGSFQRAMTKAAAAGIFPDGVNGTIIPFKEKGVPVATFIPMYRGLIGKAVEGGEVSDIQAHVVYEGDKFRYAWGLANVLEHEPSDKPKKDRAKTHVYAVARFKDNRAPMFEVMTADEVLAIKVRARAQSGPWQTDEGEMWRKTVTKRLCKYLPGLPIELQQAITDDDLDIATAEVLDDGRPKRPATLEEMKAAWAQEQGPDMTLANAVTVDLAKEMHAAGTLRLPPQDPPYVPGDESEPWAKEEDPFAEDAAQAQPGAQAGSGLDPANVDAFRHRLRFGQVPAQGWEAWANERVWSKGMLKEWTPAQVIHGSQGGKRHAALRGSLDYAKAHYGPNDVPQGAVYADFALAFMEEKWAREGVKS